MYARMIDKGKGVACYNTDTCSWGSLKKLCLWVGWEISPFDLELKPTQGQDVQVPCQQMLNYLIN